jgi:hypothetical protein
MYASSASSMRFPLVSKEFGRLVQVDVTPVALTTEPDARYVAVQVLPSAVNCSTFFFPYAVKVQVSLSTCPLVEPKVIVTPLARV